MNEADSSMSDTSPTPPPTPMPEISLRESPDGNWHGSFKLSKEQMDDWLNNCAPLLTGTRVFLMPLDWREQDRLVVDRSGRLGPRGTFDPSPYYAGAADSPSNASSTLTPTPDSPMRLKEYPDGSAEILDEEGNMTGWMDQDAGYQTQR